MAIRDDTHLCGEVMRALGRTPEVDVNDLQVQVVDGIARLSGVVRTRAEADAAIHAAASVPGVRSVDDSLAVETPHVSSDRSVERDANSRMDGSTQAGSRAVGAQVQRGRALLKGNPMSEADLEDAEMEAALTPGVVDVVVEAGVHTANAVDPVTIANDVAERIGDDTEIKGTVRPLSTNETGVIRLTGRVAAPEQRERAEWHARRTPGVHRVENEIEVGTL